MTLKRRTPLRPRRRALTRGEGIKPVGDGKRKKMARYRAFMQSPEWKAIRKAAIERAGGRCEYHEARDVGDREVWLGHGYLSRLRSVRCTCVATTVHHRSYQRFGGQELPEDLQALCQYHHDMIEARDFPHRRHSRRAATQGRTNG